MGEEKAKRPFPWGGRSWMLLPRDAHGDGKASKMAAWTSRVNGRRAGV